MFEYGLTGVFGRVFLYPQKFEHFDLKISIWSPHYKAGFLISNNEGSHDTLFKKSEGKPWFCILRIGL